MWFEYGMIVEFHLQVSMMQLNQPGDEEICFEHPDKTLKS